MRKAGQWAATVIGIFGLLFLAESFPLAGNSRDTARVKIEEQYTLFEREIVMDDGRISSRGTWRSNPAGGDDLRHGRHITYYYLMQDDGTYEQGTLSDAWYSMNRAHGPVRMWHRNGQLWIDGSRVDGKRHGLEKSWFDNGQLHYERSYVGGELHGMTTEWRDTGQKLHATAYIHDKRQGSHTAWFENGNRKEKGEYVGDLKYGQWTYWHENGQRESEGEYELFQSVERGEPDSRKVGEWKYWDDEGKLIRTEDHGEAKDSDD